MGHVEKLDLNAYVWAWGPAILILLGVFVLVLLAGRKGGWFDRYMDRKSEAQSLVIETLCDLGKQGVKAVNDLAQAGQAQAAAMTDLSRAVRDQCLRDDNEHRTMSVQIQVLIDMFKDFLKGRAHD